MATDDPYLHAFDSLNRPREQSSMDDHEIAAMATQADRDALLHFERRAGDPTAQSQIAWNAAGGVERARQQREATYRRNLAAASKANQAQVYEQYQQALVSGDRATAARLATGHPQAIASGHRLDEATMAEREALALADLPKSGKLREYRQMIREGRPHLAAQFRAIHRTRITDAERRLGEVLRGK